jgi:Asp-tRNA(Asn)/Glu-tRNA(Gln) amidotransferase A subunit family amidase
VADGMVPLALGTQTAGSIVRPASFCGIHGFKPTFGVVPTDGVKPVSASLDTIGPLARDVDDLALGAAVLADDPAPFRSERDHRPRVAFARTAQWPQIAEPTRAALLGTARALDLDEVALPDAWAGLVAAQHTIMEAEAARALGTEHAEHADRLSDQLRTLLDAGARIDDAAVADAHAVARRCRALLADVFAEVDALLVPAVLGEAPEGLTATGDPLPCRAWTLLGTPAVAVPGLTGPAGAPLGVQVVADRGRDADALAAAAWLGERLAGETTTR